MQHWTDDRRIHSLMTHLGKTGKSGKPTRSAFAAEKVSEIMIKIEPRVAELRSVNKELEGLHAHLAKLKDLIDNKARHAEGIKIEFEGAKEDLLSQNPNADVDAFNKDLRQALNDLESDFKNAMSEIDGVKQKIRVKRTTMRGLEDRMKMYETQAFKYIDQLMKDAEARAARKSA